MSCVYETFCMRYLKTGIKPIKISCICSLVKIYLFSNGIYKLDMLKFTEALERMKYANINQQYYYVDFRPYKKQDKTHKYVRNCLENMGHTVLHELKCPYDNNLEYDFAFIYNGWFGTYLYYILIEDDDIVKTEYAINNAYLIKLNKNVYNTKNTVTQALNKWFFSSPVTDINNSSYNLPTTNNNL
jgi:hypothetical protein